MAAQGSNDDGMWKTVVKKPVMKRGRWMEVEEHHVELPDGKSIPDWAWIITPNFINVAVVARASSIASLLPSSSSSAHASSTQAHDDEFRWLMFRQPKYAVGLAFNVGTTLAPVGGYIDGTEEPLAAAKRELMEEMGLEAPQWIHLGSMVAG